MTAGGPRHDRDGDRRRRLPHDGPRRRRCCGSSSGCCSCGPPGRILRGRRGRCSRRCSCWSPPRQSSSTRASCRTTTGVFRRRAARVHVRVVGTRPSPRGDVAVVRCRVRGTALKPTNGSAAVTLAIFIGALPGQPAEADSTRGSRSSGCGAAARRSEARSSPPGCEHDLGRARVRDASSLPIYEPRRLGASTPTSSSRRRPTC